MDVLVTGGAGFIGSHLTHRLIEQHQNVTVADNYSNGRAAWVPDGARMYEGDLTDQSFVQDLVTAEYDAIFHLASRKAVNDDQPRSQFRENTEMTYSLLEAALDRDIPEFFFTSSSTVYGKAPRPTPEDHGPLEPISAYGASKIACEALCAQTAHSHGLTVYNVRFANIVGERLRDAVIPDFIQKLRGDSESLEILGDGRQEKSYMHIDDCIDAMLHVFEHADAAMNTFNLGTTSTTSVTRIAEMVAREMELDPAFDYTGGQRGWIGDVPNMHLSIERLRQLGWRPTLTSDEAVRRATIELVDELTV